MLLNTKYNPQKSPRTFKILPKGQNFSKSGHTDEDQPSEERDAKKSAQPWRSLVLKCSMAQRMAYRGLYLMAYPFKVPTP